MPLTVTQSFTQPVNPEGADLFGAVRQLVKCALTEVGIRIAPADELHLSVQVPLVVEQHTFRRMTIASGAADFLVIRFHRARNICVNDKADVLFVDSHAEGVCRQYQPRSPLHEVLLDRSALLAIQVAMVADMIDALGLQPFAEFRQNANQCEIDDPAAGCFRSQPAGEHRLHGLLFLVGVPDFFDSQFKVRAVDPLMKHPHL